MSKKWIAFILAVSLMLGQAAVVSASEHTTPPVTETDTISGTYGATFPVTLTSNEPDATIYYTLDGSVPTETNNAGSGTGTVTLSVYGFYTELAYRAKGADGIWESPNREFYKISNDPVVPVASTNTYYTNYVNVDGNNLVYARKVNNGGGWAYRDVHLVQNGTDTAIAENLAEEVDFTGISDDHVIFGSESGIYRYSITGGQTTQVYASAMTTPDISRVKIEGNRIAFIEDGKLKILDIADPAQPQATVLDGDPYWNMVEFDPFDLKGNKVVWKEGDQVYLQDLSSGSVAAILNGIYADHLMLTDTTVYYADEDALFAYNIDDGQTSKLATNLDYGNLPFSPMEIDDRANPSFIVFRGYSDNGSWIGVLNLATLVVKYTDFDGAYSDLLAYDIGNGAVYWTKEHLYYDETLKGYYISKSPLYSLDLNNLPPDSTAPTVSLNPNAASFAWDGAAKFSADEEIWIRYTLDGTDPTATNGYSATILDKVPVFQSGLIRFNAVDFAGNPMAVQTSGPFTVANEAERVTSNDEWEEFAAAGNSIVYATGDEKLYLYDIPTRRSTLLAAGFTGYNLDFDGRYLVYESTSADLFTSNMLYWDLATGQTGEIAQDAADPHIKDGKMAYIDQSGDTDGVSVYDFTTGETIVIPESLDDLEDPYISGNLVVFSDWRNDTAYVYALDTDTLTTLAPPGTIEINEAVPMDGKVYLIADEYDELWVYDAVTGGYTDLTADSGTASFSGLSADKVFGKKVAVTDDDHNKILVYDTQGGTFTSVGSGEFYLYDPQITGNVLVMQGDYGLPIPQDELFWRLLSVDMEQPQVTVDPAAGSYGAVQTVSFAVYGEPTSVFYTLDGSEPTLDGFNPAAQAYKYYGPFTLTGNTTLKYFAMDTAGDSVVGSVYYVIDYTAPEVAADPPGGFYREPQTVFLSSNEPAEISYSVDGSEPSVIWSVYEQENGLRITDNTVLTFKATDALGNESMVQTVQYVIDPDAPQVSVTPAGGLFHGDVTVAMTVYQDESPVTVYYTLDGSEPTTASAPYANPFKVTRTGDLKYFAQDAAGNRTDVMTIHYEIVKIPPTATLSPVAGSSGIPVGAPIAATFDADVTLQNPGGVTIMSGNRTVPGVSASLSGRALTISHGGLQSGTTYLVQIAADTVRNLYEVGNEPISWSFTTAFNPPSAPPAVPPEGPETENEEEMEQGTQEIRLGEENYTVSHGTAEDGRTLTTVQIDAGRLTEAARSFKEIGAKAVVLQIDEAADAAEIQIPAAAMANAAAEAPDAVLSVRIPAASYDLPFGLLGLADLADDLGTGLENMRVVVTISRATGETAGRFAVAAGQSGAQMLGDLIEFRITVEAGGQSREVNGFGNTFVSRSIFVSQPADGSSATAVLYDPETGEMTFVPAVFTAENGKTRVTIKRNGNSLYAVLSVRKTFADVTGHWAEADMELLASKMLVRGKDARTFAPNDAITRAEFAALIVRALGLTQDEPGASFSDVQTVDWYAGAVVAAAKAGVISGYEDGSFRPNERITREQMAVLVSRALSFVGREVVIAGRQDALLARFSDRQDISGWALDEVAQSVEAGIISGLTGGKFAAKENATRAQAVVMLKKLLQFVEFMN